MLTPENSFNVELHEDHYSYFKIVPQSQKNPVVFKIEQLSKHPLKFEAFISTITKEPKKSNCEKMILNVKWIKRY